MTVQVKISNLELALQEPEMLCECLAKINQSKNVDVAIWVSARSSNGWLEWGLDFHFASSKLFIGAIQRKPGEKYEFHS